MSRFHGDNHTSSIQCETLIVTEPVTSSSVSTMARAPTGGRAALSANIPSGSSKESKRLVGDLAMTVVVATSAGAGSPLSVLFPCTLIADVCVIDGPGGDARAAKLHGTAYGASERPKNS